MAQGTGQSIRSVLAEPYGLTLWAWWMMQEQAERERLRLEHLRIDTAGLQAIAFHDPKQLGKIEERFLARARSSAETPEQREAWKETAKERLQRLRILRPISPEEAGVAEP